MASTRTAPASRPPLTDEEERILAQDAVVDDVAQARDASQRCLALSEDEIEREMERQVE